MKTKRSLPILGLLSLLIASCGNDEGLQTSQVSIVGGERLPNDKKTRSALSATIGMGDFCSGTRIADNLYITAAHCAVVLREGFPLSMVASNSYVDNNTRPTNIRIHPSYKAGKSHLERKSDVALFSLNFLSVEHKQEWDKFTSIAPIDYSFPTIGRDVIVAGIGCEEKNDFPWYEKLNDVTIDLNPVIPWSHKFDVKCTKSPEGQYMKFAKNKIIKMEDERYFRLKGSSSDEGITGFISNGDSGGPNYSTTEALIGVTSSASYGVIVGDDGFGKIETFHAWLGYADVKSWLEEARSRSYPLFSEKEDLLSVDYPNGDSYYGGMALGYRSGKGRLGYSDGRVYEGGWLSNMREGYGEQTWPSSEPKYTSYKGGWAHDKMNGTGTVIFKSGEIYEGEIKDNQYHGKGKRTMPNKDIREGTWVQGSLQGDCILTTVDGTRWQEVYKDGKRISAIKL